MGAFSDMSGPKTAAVKMDAMYRLQRHIYDFTRKPYLLGRDLVIRELAVPTGGDVLEIGCGTARNLICMAQRYPRANYYGIDVSNAMLETARLSIARSKLETQIQLAQADATGFDAPALFGREKFDRVVISYALSMMPDWEGVLRNSGSLLRPGGSLHIADFGDGDALGPFRNLVRAWLALFSVVPRITLRGSCGKVATEIGASYRFRQLYRGYVAIAELKAST